MNGLALGFAAYRRILRVDYCAFEWRILMEFWIVLRNISRRNKILYIHDYSLITLYEMFSVSASTCDDYLIGSH